MQSSRKGYDKLHTEMQECRMMEDRTVQNKALQTSLSKHESQSKEENSKVRLVTEAYPFGSLKTLNH